MDAKTHPGLVGHVGAARQARVAVRELVRVQLEVTPRSERPGMVDVPEAGGLRALRREDGGEIGTVKAVYDFGAGDMLEIARPDGRTVLIPFTRAAVPQVDLAGGRVVVDPPVEIEAPEGGPAAETREA